jgi:hypothetical protein
MKLARGSDVSDLDDSWWQYSLITKVCDTAGKVDITPSTFGNLECGTRMICLAEKSAA